MNKCNGIFADIVVASVAYPSHV